MHADPILWFTTIGPLALLCVAIFSPKKPDRRNARTIASAGIVAAGVALVSAAVTAMFVALRGPMRTPALGVHGIGFGIYVDALGATMFLLVSLIGLIVVAYSRNYLEGDAGHPRFTGLLCSTLAAVLLLIISGNCFAFAIAWFATSVGLNKLLLFYDDRPAAILAARKEWLASRLGDLCLIAAIGLIYAQVKSLDYADVFAAAAAFESAHATPFGMHVVAMLIVGTALLKSAQFPLHGWLTEVMETPTPVSAFLHAGIVNAGGFLILRFAHAVVLSRPALETLMLAGACSALFGSVVMLTQTSVKARLAYSTIAQMGFMLVECGLGAFPAALLHIVAHSLYKAHAFLSSGSVIDLARASWTPSPGGKPHPARFGIAIVGVLAIAVLAGRYGDTYPMRPDYVLRAALLLGLAYMIARAIDERPSSYVVGRTLTAAVIVAIGYGTLQAVAGRFYWDIGSAPDMRDPFVFTAAAIVTASFASITFLQDFIAADAGSARWQGWYAHVSNGFYVTTLLNRVLLRTRPISLRSFSHTPLAHEAE